jgi:hypothetical protein
MLGVRHTGRVAWRRKHASRHYIGYVLVTDDAVRLAGDEDETGIHAVLSIPPTAIEGTRVGRDPCEEVVGEQAVVIELADHDPIFLRPIGTGPLSLDDLARKLSFASNGAVTAAS